jgi:hypothetical protein
MTAATTRRTCRWPRGTRAVALGVAGPGGQCEAEMLEEGQKIQGNIFWGVENWRLVFIIG